MARTLATDRTTRVTSRKATESDDGPSRLYSTKNDLPQATRVQVIELLNQRLADCIDLQTQCKQAHWNVKGPSFIALHKLFDEINEDVEEYVDLLAERDRAARRHRGGDRRGGGGTHQPGGLPAGALDGCRACGRPVGRPRRDSAGPSGSASRR